MIMGTHTMNFAYDASGTPMAASSNGTQLYSLTYGYDYLRRLSGVDASVNVADRTYVYKDLSDTQTTTQVSQVSYSGLPSNPSYIYTYDAQGQLLSATNGTTTYTYTYDGFGNLKTANGHSYTYGNAQWRDLLTAYDGQSISYDGSGNPTSYYNGTRWTFEWAEGRNLVKAIGGGHTVTYAYDHNGVRTSKTVDGTTHTYYYASGKLLRETYGSNTLDFFYDASGTPFALKHNGTMYYYITNLQGDVMQLVNASGAVVASYEYDPYGNTISSSGDLASINPLRYRGYVYDQETELYYLQSRYYDPQIGRFINADALASTGQGLLGYNMFAYCNNNPVVRSDPAGTFGTLGLSVLGAVFGAVVSYAGEVIQNYRAGATGITAWTADINWGRVAASAFSGALSAISGSRLVSATLDVVGSAIIENGVNCISGEAWDTTDVLTDIACNTISEVGGTLLSKLPILNTGLEVPRFIRDIKDDARGIFNIKGKKKLDAYLNCIQTLVTASNAFIDDAIGRIAESKFKKPINSFLEGVI